MQSAINPYFHALRHLHGDACARVPVQAPLHHIHQRPVTNGREGDAVVGINDGVHLLNEGQMAAANKGMKSV